MSSVKFLLPYIRQFKAKIIATIVLSFVLALLKGAQAYLVKPIFDSGLSPNTPASETWLLAGALFGLMLLNFPCRFYHFYWIRAVVDRATCLVRADLYGKLQRLPMKFFVESKHGNLISNILNDTHTFSQGFKGAIDLIREPLTAAFMLGLAMYRDWQLTLIIFAVSPLFIIIFNSSGKRVKKSQVEVQQDLGELTHSINEGLTGQKIIKAFNLRAFSLKRFNLAQDHYFNSQMKTTVTEEIAHPLVELVGALAFSLIIVFAHYRISSGFMTTGDFVSFVTAMALFMDPIRKYSQANIKLNQANAAAERLQAVLTIAEEKNDGPIKTHHFTGSIEIKNLSFSYGHHEVLSDFNLTLEKGRKVALVGLSGSGKSTLVNILLGLYPIEQGEILIDGHSIRDFSKEALRDLFGLVSQDIFLFNDSVRGNLNLDRQFSDEDLRLALKVANAQDFVEKLPNGLDTLLGDRGARLSGGQQQRITIARAYLRNAPIFLFDEATSALDNESEKLVQAALDQITGGKTVLAVAHRLSTIQNYDQIVVMQDGKILETGRHEQLLAQQGEYSRLYQLGRQLT